MKILNIHSAWFLPEAHYTRLKIYIISPLLKQNKTFSKTFFPSIITEWNNLDPHLRKSDNFSVFKKNILKFIQPSPNSLYNCHNHWEICLITRFRLDLSHLNSGWNKEKLAGWFFLLFWENDRAAITIISWGFGYIISKDKDKDNINFNINADTSITPSHN